MKPVWLTNLDAVLLVGDRHRRGPLCGSTPCQPGPRLGGERRYGQRRRPARVRYRIGLPTVLHSSGVLADAVFGWPPKHQDTATACSWPRPSTAWRPSLAVVPASSGRACIGCRGCRREGAAAAGCSQQAIGSGAASGHDDYGRTCGRGPQVHGRLRSGLSRSPSAKDSHAMNAKQCTGSAARFMRVLLTAVLPLGLGPGAGQG